MARFIHDLSGMESRYASLIHELDALEALCALRAYPGARWRLLTVERLLRCFIDLQVPAAKDPTDDVLWKLAMRVRAAIECSDETQINSAIDDLRAELNARMRQAAYDRAAPAP